jgi:hypothetical protein
MHAALLLFTAVVAFAIAGLILLRSEKLYVVALTEVQLYHPVSVVGEHNNLPRIVSVMSPGESLPVTECVDRKSDIEVRVEYAAGQTAIVGWKPGAYALRRQQVYLWSAGATYSCRLLPGEFISPS